jgi:hypothetical protein
VAGRGGGARPGFILNSFGFSNIWEIGNVGSVFFPLQIVFVAFSNKRLGIFFETVVFLVIQLILLTFWKFSSNFQ